MRRPLAIAFAAGILLAPTLSAAHIDLVDPPHRYDRRTQKTAPCGKADGVRGDSPTVFQAGETITVRWNEYIDHPGHFRISFDADGHDDFVDPVCTDGCNSRSPTIEQYSNDTVLLDGIEDKSGGDYSAQVTLPDVACDNCTLQLIQVMYDKPPYELPGNDIYYNCADIVLEQPSGGDVFDAGDTGGTVDASDAADSSDQDAADTADQQDATGHDSVTSDTIAGDARDANLNDSDGGRADEGCASVRATPLPTAVALVWLATLVAFRIRR